MFLKRLELQGFKTFAKKTTLEFLAPKNDESPLTCIVGPNGSGKSNLADAVRWALGEQSIKLLRGKQTEDVIFSGSEGKSRAGFAEVALTFDNQKKTISFDAAEIEITRRLYRDGQSEYLVNGRHARLTDIHQLLAEANVGQRSYSVIGQGMVDHILISSPEERKQFFDDATGVKSLQLKRHEATLKLKRTYENVTEIELFLNELTPRLRSLKRQVSRLEEREEVEKTLKQLEDVYYGILWWSLQDQFGQIKPQLEHLQKQKEELIKNLSLLDAQMQTFESQEKTTPEKDDGFISLQQDFHTCQKTYRSLQEEELRLQKEMELTKIRAQENWSPLPLVKIIDELESLIAQQKTLAKELLSKNPMVERMGNLMNQLIKQAEIFLGKLKRPDTTQLKTDPKLIEAQTINGEKQKEIKQKILSIEKDMAAHASKEKQSRHLFFEVQKQARLLQTEIHALEQKENQVQISQARLEERQKNLDREMQEQVEERKILLQTERVQTQETPEKLYPEIQRLRYKLELIGGIDPEIVKEYKEIEERHHFLDEQMKDLSQAITTTEDLIDTLDKDIKQQSEKAFQKINKEFQHFFTILFGGGSCGLVKMTQKDLEEQSEDLALQIQEKENKKPWEKRERITGIEIEATPPGKRLKALNLLSGGERALTSLALVSAIMAVNPSPFVILDEVDAALDEANTIRFAAILKELRKLTQFIVITHNRATMEKADILYGVTMGDGGVSHLLSVHLEDLTKNATARR